MANYAHLLSLMVNTPLMAHPRKAAVVFNYLRWRSGMAGLELPDIDAARIDALRPEREGSAFVGSQPDAGPGTYLRREPYRVDGGVGIISTVGSMVNRGGWIGDDGSGMVSYEGTKFQYQRAAQDSRVHSIIADMNNPGGEANGAMMLARIVREVAAIKPVYAVVNGMAASAGYAQISGATQIITTPDGLSGSIGVVMLHLDHSAMLENDGVLPTFIHAGARKVQGNALQPLSDDDAKELQAEVDATYDLFLETVGLGRGNRLTPAKARATEAGTFMGQQAVDLGLADAIGSFEDVLQEAQARARRAAGSRSNGQRSSAMSVLGNSDQQSAPAPQPSATTFTQAQMDTAVATARREAAATATQEAGARFAAILGSDKVAGREAAALAMAIENPGMSADGVLAFVEKHIPAVQAGAIQPQRQTIAERAKAEGGANGLNNAPVNPNPAKPGGEETDDDKAVKAGWGAATKNAQGHLAGRTGYVTSA